MLFKILHGDASHISTNITPYHEGYCYVTHNGDFYVDMNDERVKLNAKNAETLCGESLENILTAIEAASSRVSTITLDANNWSGTSNPWSQIVTINGVTPNTKIDLQPTAIQIVELQDSGIALVAENNDGIATVYALGEKPTINYTMQATLTEVVPV